MGCCASSHSYGSSNKVDQIMSSMPPTPIKKDQKPTNVEPVLVSFPSNSQVSHLNSLSSDPSFAESNDEFFDPEGLLDSETDDDFYSVNGDFTPRSGTPVHNTLGTPRLRRVFSPQVTRAVFEGKLPQRSASNPSLVSKSLHRSLSSTTTTQTSKSADSITTSTTKGKLRDLFRESPRYAGEGSTPQSPLRTKPTTRSPSFLRYSISSTDIAIAPDNFEPEKEKFTNRCFPKLTNVRSLKR